MAAQLADLSDNEKLLHEAVNTGNTEEIKRLLNEKNVRVDCLDKNGTTPLQHAAYKANKDLCQLLLSHGANVNSNYHDNGYTALMFAALSGNTEVTKVILEAGAKVNLTNSVGRTASQLAAFVGQHEVATFINNFFSIELLTPYTTKQALETEPRLPAELAQPLYKLISFNNLHPVKLSLYLKENKQLLEHSTKVVRVLVSLVEKMMKQANTNDVMAVKMNYLACLVREMSKATQDNDVNNWIKMLLRGREPDGFALKQEEFIRSSMKEFPYIESQLLQQMIRNLASVKMGHDPTAMTILSQGINGQRFFAEESACSTCGEPKAEKKCSSCKMVNYCNQDCQKLHWFTHKKFCKTLKAEGERLEKLKEEQKKKDEEENLRRKKLVEEADAEKSSTSTDVSGEVKSESADPNTEVTPPSAEAVAEMTEAIKELKAEFTAS